MERTNETLPIRGRWVLGTVGLMLLLVWQGWLTLGLFGREDPWGRLLNDQPIVSGCHPLHQYHGWLGARSLMGTGHLCCYDPAFQAGYPKTPIFDSGSRPAEFCLALVGGEFTPAAYKIGLAVCCLLVPVLLWLAASGAGLGPAGCLVSMLAGLLVWWSVPGQRALAAGDIELLLSALALLAHVGQLVHFHRSPSVLVWLGLVVTACLGWFAHPLLFPLVVPLFLVYYLSTGVKHRYLIWHVGLFFSQLAGLLINGFWLWDWVKHWWIRSPLPQPSGLLPHRTLRAFWEADLWGTSADRVLGLVLLGSCLLGTVLWQWQRQRTAARLLGLGTVGLFTLALLGISWEPLGRLGTSGLLLPALWFATIPATYLWIMTARALVCWRVALLAKVLPLGLLAGLTALFLPEEALTLAQRCCNTEPLEIGLTEQRQHLVQLLREQTTTEARILWEDHAGVREVSRWPALLPLLTERSYLGGLDPLGQIEHSHAGIVRGLLAGQPVAQWSDEGLQDYCRRYNLGWAVLWSPPSIERFRQWKGAQLVTKVQDGEKTGCFFRIERSQPSFTLYGQARLLQADCQHITLADVVPENGRVVLSFHFQKGMKAYPARVQVEREPDPRDSIPLIRLRLSSPVSRLTLTWDRP